MNRFQDPWLPSSHTGPGLAPHEPREAPRQDPAARSPHPRKRVVKTLLPGSPGTLKLTQRFGAALVCVRQRLDPSGQHRTTTVELVVDTTPIRAKTEAEVAQRVAFAEHEMRSAVRLAGGRLDAEAELWRLSRKEAVRLRLLDRIVG